LEYSIPSGSNVSLTVVQSSDTADNLIDGTFSLGADKIYSLFVCGTVTPGGHANADYLLLQDSIPYYPAADSVIGIRYIDLLSDGGNISVNQQGNAVGSEVAGLPYKNSTGFKTYPATSNISGYVFEIRDATSQTLLTTFTLSSFVLYKNITLVIAGSGDNPQDAVVTAFQVNNY
jgi:hypothetical protein